VRSPTIAAPCAALGDCSNRAIVKCCAASEETVASIDHITLVVSDYGRSRSFYEKALAPLGIKIILDFGKACGFGREQKPDFWIGTGPASFQKAEHLAAVTPTHVAFGARSRAEVDAFHEAALAAGAKDFGAPGLRPIYHPNYYGAFVLDPDGHDIEAVFHD
jgi:catechol 2,3-dioxygenase-like lactoylglutathione lyase family enzyme